MAKAVVALFLSGFAWGEAKNLKPIGVHYPLFLVEKNENPQNVMVAYVKLDEQCRFIRDSSRPLMDFYWLMNREKFKPVHPLIKRAIRQRMEVMSETADHRSFMVRLNDLKELKRDPETSRLLVSARRVGDHCKVAAILDMEGEKLQLQSIYSEAHKTLWPPFRKLDSIKLSGLVAGERIQRRISAK